jgi:hypothetical protein
MAKTQSRTSPWYLWLALAVGLVLAIFGLVIDARAPAGRSPGFGLVMAGLVIIIAANIMSITISRRRPRPDPPPPR